MGLFSRKKSNSARDKPVSSVGRFAPTFASIFGSQEAASLKGSEAIYAAVGRISNAIACMALHLYKEYEIAKDDPRERLVSYAPNANMTPYAFKLAMEACRNTTGVAYGLIVPKADGTTPERIDVLQPARVMPMLNTDTQELWYQITLDSGQLATVHNSYMIALKHMSSDGINAISPMEVLRGTLKYDRRIKEISVNKLEQVGGGVILNVPTGLNQEKRDEYIKAFLAAYRASNGQAVVLDGGITATTFTGSLVDPKIMDVDSITKNKVATVYNLPPRMLGDTKSSGYTTSEQDIAEFLKLSVMPIVRQWEEMLNRKLLTYDEICTGYAFRFSIDDLRRGDTDAMSNKFQKGVRGGWLTPNEARREDGRPPLPNGDTPLVSRDMMPLSLIVEHPELLLGKGNQGGGDTSDGKGGKT